MTLKLPPAVPRLPHDEDRVPVMHPSDNRRRRWRLLAWTQRRKHAQQAQALAQAALDAAQNPTAPAPRGSLYRSGVTLAELQPGECGTVRILIGTTQARLRLLEMGLTPGTHVRVLRTAAFGGPLDVLVRGYQLSLRRDEAAAIWLGEEGDEAEAPPPSTP
ncbi:MAG TPA: FeoA family protein [Chthonomonadaceae bacterium]|nr:FeoA family protein [Chthonomonadaceae bacterium]